MLDLVGVLVGVNAEVAEVAAFPAKRDVMIEAERGHFAGRGGGVGFLDGGGVFLRPEGKRRIVRDEIVARAGAGFLGWCGDGIRHERRECDLRYVSEERIDHTNFAGIITEFRILGEEIFLSTAST